MTSSQASIDEAMRGELLRVLFHHLNGGLHNATLALELVARGPVEPAPSGAESSALAEAGLRGLGQAARALQLVSALLDFPRPSDAERSLELVDDVVKVLRTCAMRRRIDFRSELDRDEIAHLDFDGLVDLMTAGFAKIAAAPEAARIRMKREAGQTPARVAFDVEAAA